MSGEYPPDWSTPELGDFAKATGGSGFPPSAQGSTEGDYPFYKVSDMNLPGNERFMGDANHWITEETRKRIKARTFPVGTVIFPKIGAAVATNKKRLLTRESIIDNNVMAVVVDDPKRCAFSYLRFWFETIDLRDLSNSGALPSIPGHRVHTIRVPLPPLPEQKKIAQILSTVQRAIEAQERIIQTTTELKKALMHKLFTEGLPSIDASTGGLRHEPQKQTEIGPVPESWEVVKLSEIAKIERGKFSHRPRNEPRFYGGEYPFVQTGDVSNCDGYVRSYTQTLNKDGLAISKMFPAGTILITIAANIGFTGILEFDSACPDSLIGITPNENVHTGFLNYYLITQQPAMDRLAPKNTQKNINIQFLKPWPVPLPSVEEQTKIAGAFSATDRKIRLATQKRSQLQDLFRTLLHELMTAKIRVTHIDLPSLS